MSSLTIALNNVSYGKFKLGIIKIKTEELTLQEHTQFYTSTKNNYL